VSLYAADKKSSELLAHIYSKLYNISSAGLRFCAVYGPAGPGEVLIHIGAWLFACLSEGSGWERCNGGGMGTQHKKIRCKVPLCNGAYFVLAF
jgi:nucleoside-diphosphate-sugar epimerase